MEVALSAGTVAAFIAIGLLAVALLRLERKIDAGIDRIDDECSSVKPVFNSKGT